MTQEQFEDISVAAVTELWSQFGPLTEIWFDGGISDRIKGRIVPLLRKLQPGAIAMGAGIENSPNEVDWIGTESGEPAYPVWSTGCTKPGQGFTGVSPKNATNFCPKCGDCTLQAPDVWFWVPNTPIKSLSDLQRMYHATVGANAVMELDFAIDRTGNVDPSHMERYLEFGNWVRNCYGAAAAATDWELANQVELTVPAGVDRIAISEDLSRGQRVTSYKVEAQDPTGVWRPFSEGSAVGHKRINLVKAPLGAASKLRLTVTDGVALPANISLAAFMRC